MYQSPTSDRAPAEADGASTLDLSGRCVGSSYILIRPIGQGATGTVWRGVDRSSGEPVAVKLLHESLLRQPKLVTRFVQERTILLMLRHRNVVRVRDLFSVGESLGLVMDLVPGGSLRDHLREHHTLPAGEAARLAAQVAAALAEAHELGVIHRDLKPDNILLRTENGRLETRLTDFGIARVLNMPSLTTPNAVVGTPHYMSPEAFHGAPASPAADVYALGVVLYELVSGHPPYDADDVADLMRLHLAGEAERRPGIPDALWTVIRSCMARKPRLRPTAAELVGELTAVARDAVDAPALPPPAPRRADRDGPAWVAPASAGSPRPGAAWDGPAGEDPPRHRPTGGHSPGHGPTDGQRVGEDAAVPRPRSARRRNRAPSWRWGRAGTVLAVLAAAMLASGVATTAWHLARADGGSGRSAAAASAGGAAVSAGGAAAPAGAAGAAGAATRPSPGLTASPAPISSATRRPAPRPASVSGQGGPATTPQAKAATASRTGTPEAKPYGPWQCTQRLHFAAAGDPVLAGTCHALGARVQVRGTLAAPPGGTATVALSVRDTSSGRTVATARTCDGLVFADRQVTRDCGPATVSLPRGHTYVVVMSWTYTKGAASTKGTQNGAAFAWF